MAKLAAHGSEVARVERFDRIESFEAGRSFTVRVRLALMSDGWLLIERTFNPHTPGARHSDGWKLYGKATAAMQTATAFVTAFARGGYAEVSR